MRVRDIKTYVAAKKSMKAFEMSEKFDVIVGAATTRTAKSDIKRRDTVQN